LKKRNEQSEKKNSSDTIAAIATPTGSGGIGVVRISGPRASAILRQIFIPKKVNSKPAPYLLRLGKIVDSSSGQALDEVMAAFMPGPKSFTGEDMVEFYCHAGQFTVRAILDEILCHDCRPAEAGEFSLRRFVNHGVDMTTLEGAADIVSAKTELAYRLSREHLLGAYGDHITELRSKIVHLLAEIEADIDFPDEDAVGSIGRDLLNTQLDTIIDDIDLLAGSYRAGKIIRDGFRVVILGPPNAGKSSLFNRLVRHNRALVTPIAGTTRDYLSEWIDIEGLPVELYDTAGLRKGRGTVERAGIEETRKLINLADLILYIVDVSAKIIDFKELTAIRKRPSVVLLNKADLLPSGSSRADNWQSKLGKFETILISAKTGRGMKQLSRRIYELAGVADLTDSLVVTSRRHKLKLDRCLAHLKKIKSLADMPAEIISFELRQAAERIGEITGHIYTEQILDEIFANFCIGK